MYINNMYIKTYEIKLGYIRYIKHLSYISFNNV